MRGLLAILLGVSLFYNVHLRQDQIAGHRVARQAMVIVTQLRASLSGMGDDLEWFLEYADKHRLGCPA